MQNCNRVAISDSHFCLSEMVGDAMLEKELMPNPCHVAGLITPIETGEDEHGVPTAPAVSRLEYGVYDPEKRLAGRMKWRLPWGVQKFPVVCSDLFHVSPFRDDVEKQ